MKDFFIGLDIGSSATKAVALGGDRVVASVVLPSTPDMASAAERAVASLGVEACPVLTTGYGRHLYPGRIGDAAEITALVAGVCRVDPDARFAVDIGGQDSKVVRIEAGRVSDFAMNDRCAAGTGRFLEVMSRVLGVGLEGLDELATGPGEPVTLTSTCTVFAESEVVGLLSRGTPPARIVKGLLASIADRVAGLARQVGVIPPVAGTGGALRIAGLAAALSRSLGAAVRVPESPQIVTALGAAILCGRRVSAAG